MPLFRKQTIIQVTSRVPDLIKTIADDADYVLLVDDIGGNPYKITKSNLLAGLSSGGSAGSGGTSTDTYFSDVVLLAHLDDLVDVKGKTLTLVANAQIITTDHKFGIGCLFLDGNGDCLLLPNNTDFDFSTGNNFTIEFSAKLTSLTSAFEVLCARSVQNSDSTFNLDINSTTIRITGWYAVYISIAHELKTDAWHYIAVTREGNVLKLFINGILVGSYTGATNFPNTNRLCFGGDPLSGAGATIYGKIDEIRITKRVRSMSGIPSTAFPNS